MSTTTSHGNPLAEVGDGVNWVRVYEEIPGQLTVSVSKSPGMWASFTVPAEAAYLIGEAIEDAQGVREEQGRG